MEKLKMHSPDLTHENTAKIQGLFPNCVTETWDKNGNLKLAVDFDQLRQELSDSIVEGPQERYHLNWPGKREALLTANAPIAKTLRPCREESVNFDTTKNIFIEGDNLEALKLLQESYLGKVKMIYIDPPYNTRNDHIYKDDFAQDIEVYFKQSNQKDNEGNRLVPNTESKGRLHSDWLNMMYPRLKLARNLLQDDGILLISIDENEQHNLKKITDEIFGCDNYVSDIIWKNSSKNDQSFISVQHEYFLCYVKNKQKNLGNWKEKKEGLNEIYKAFKSFYQKHGDNWDQIHKEALEWFKQFPESNPISNSKHYSWMDSKGIYFPDNISGPNFGQYRYDVLHPVSGKVCKEPSSGWRFPEETMKQKILDGLIHFGKDETTIPNNKTYLKNTEFQSIGSVKFKDGRIASKALRKLMGGNYFTNPKDHELLGQLFKAMGVNDDDIIIDFFSGSSSTAHAAMQMNAQDGGSRKFIMIQLPEPCEKKSEAYKAGYKNIAEISKERVRRAGKMFLNSNCHEHWNKDIGFRVFKIDSSNMKDVYYRPDDTTQVQLDFLTDNIKHDRTEEDLLFQVLQDWGVYENLSLPIRKETIQEKTVFFVDNNALVACFDKKLSEEFVKKLTEYKPLRVVFRDIGFASDAVKINVEQIFKQMSPETEVRTI